MNARPTIDAPSIIADYCAAGLRLVPIAPRSKGPRVPGWNRKESAVTSPKGIPEGYGVGLAHAWSGTCAIDVDDRDLARAYLAEHKIDLDAMLADPANVQVVSGKANRAKLIFRMPNKIVLPSKTVMDKSEGHPKMILELRSGTADGLTVQDCLPPTIHPEVCKPYEWRGDWRNIPELPMTLHSLWCDIIDRDKERNIVAGDGAINTCFEEIEQALYCIPANCDRKTHTECGMALRLVGEQLHDLGGAAQLFLKWSATGGDKFKGLNDVLYQFGTYRNDKEKLITVATLFMHARANGWKRKEIDVVGLFDSMTLEKELARHGFPASTPAELVPPVTMSEELGLAGYVGLRLPYYDDAGEPVMDGGKPYSRVLVIGTKWKNPYRKRIGAGVHAYLPKQIDWASVKVSAAPIFIVEGEKAANLLADTGTIIIGLESIASFRDGGKVLPEISSFDWSQRKVFILPNEINERTLRAGAGLAAWLHSRKAVATLVNFLEYDDPNDASAKKMHLIANNNAGYVDLNNMMGVGWEKFAEALGEVAYIKDGGLWTHLTDFCGPGKNPVRTSAMMTTDLANRNVEVGEGRVKPVFKMVQQSAYRIDVEGTVFYPHEAPMRITSDGRNFNTWGGFRLTPKRNEEIAAKIRAAVRSFFSTWTPFGVLQSEEQVMCERYFWGWKSHIAHCLPERPTTSITFQSKEQGIGKSLLLEMDKSYMGDVCKIITPKDLFSEYSNWMEGAYYVIVNEPSTSDNKHTQDLKALRTNPVVSINIKKGAKYEVPNVMVFAMTTNESHTHAMDEDERRDFIYSPTWMSITSARALPEGAERDGHLHHNELMIELATHLAPNATARDRDEWASALYAMLLEIDPAEMGFHPNAPAPATVDKKRMARSSADLQKSEDARLIADIGRRIDQHGGVAFTNRTLADYLQANDFDTRPLVAKRLIEREIALVRGLTVTQNFNCKVGSMFNNLYWTAVEGYGGESEQVRVFSVGKRSFGSAIDAHREAWIKATLN